MSDIDEKTIPSLRFSEGQRPFSNNEIFWDIDIERLDFEEDKSYIAERVFVHGTESDERAFYKYYGRENAREIIKRVKYLDDITIEYVSELHNIKKEELLCCIKR